MPSYQWRFEPGSYGTVVPDSTTWAPTIAHQFELNPNEGRNKPG